MTDTWESITADSWNSKTPEDLENIVERITTALSNKDLGPDEKEDLKNLRDTLELALRHINLLRTMRDKYYSIVEYIERKYGASDSEVRVLDLLKTFSYPQKPIESTPDVVKDIGLLLSARQKYIYLCNLCYGFYHDPADSPQCDMLSIIGEFGAEYGLDEEVFDFGEDDPTYEFNF